jgi:hypothetical protein
LLSAPIYALVIIIITTGIYEGEIIPYLHKHVFSLFATASGALVYQFYRAIWGIACLVSLL